MLFEAPNLGSEFPVPETQLQLPRVIGDDRQIESQMLSRAESLEASIVKLERHFKSC